MLSGVNESTTAGNGSFSCISPQPCIEFIQLPGNAYRKSRASELRGSRCMTIVWDVGQKALLLTWPDFFSPSKRCQTLKHGNIEASPFQNYTQSGLGMLTYSQNAWLKYGCRSFAEDVSSQLQAVHCLWETVQSGVVLPGAGLTHGSTYQPYDNLKGFGREAWGSLTRTW